MPALNTPLQSETSIASCYRTVLSILLVCLYQMPWCPRGGKPSMNGNDCKHATWRTLGTMARVQSLWSAPFPLFYTSHPNMFYGMVDGLPRLVCTPKPNTDASGVTAIYIQAALSILMSSGFPSPNQIIATNISLQIVGLSLLGAAYFDDAIDIPHTIIVSHMAVLLFSCRITALDFRPGSKMTRKLRGIIMCIDLITVPLLLTFNLSIWQTLRHIEVYGPSPCPDNADLGEWILWGNGIDITPGSPSSGTKFAFAICIFDLVWVSSSYIMELRKMYLLQQHRLGHILDDNCFDARVWWAWNLLDRHDRHFLNSLSAAVSRIRHFYRYSILVYVVWTVEKTVMINDFPIEEDKWTFG